jgi:26S proteasome regulatory subunit T5
MADQPPMKQSDPVVAASRAQAEQVAALQQLASELDTMSRDELQVRLRALDQEVLALKQSEKRTREELRHLKEEANLNDTRVKQNSKLPYLVANIAELLDVEPDEEMFEEDTRGKKPNKGAPPAKRTQKAAVIKTTNRQTVFLPVIGLVDSDKLKPEDLVGVNKDTFLVHEMLPTEYDSRVKAMEVDEKPKEKYTDIGGLDKQIQEMMEAIVLPFTNKEQYLKIGIQAPKGVILYGSPGTGKTMLARACAAATNACFLKLAGPQLVQMYIGDGARLVRDAFALAKKKAPAIIFIDEIDAIGGRRGSEDEKGGSREVQRTMLELLAQLDGFGSSDDVKVIAATNRIDVLDPALLRSGRLDRKVEFELPDEEARARIMEIHARRMTLNPDVNFEELARSTDDMNGAQLKAVTVEAGMLALKADRLTVTHEDFVEGINSVLAKKKAAVNYFA